MSTEKNRKVANCRSRMTGESKIIITDIFIEDYNKVTYNVIIISCHRFSFFPGTSALEPVVNPTTQASSLSL
jgi:hypothetical protein